jgi:3-oxoacyl-[acyl-carrier-protein] synthase III
VPVYLSLPAVNLPAAAVPNAVVLERIRAQFRGGSLQWKALERAVRLVFQSCGTQVRYQETAHPTSPGLHAANRAADVLRENALEADSLDTVVYGSIARTVFEPATACEVAARIGATRALAFDVVAACAGPLVAVEQLLGKAAIDPGWQLGVITSASLSEGHLSYDIQGLEDLETLAAGLTIGNASTALLLGRHPFHHGGRLVATHTQGRSAHHALCQVPTNGPFLSSRATLVQLAALVPQHVQAVTERAGWRISDVDLFVFHQPSDRVLRGVARGLGVPAERVPQLHGLHANTEASAVPLALRTLHDQGKLKRGMKILLGSAAAGFTMASALVEWEG